MTIDKVVEIITWVIVAGFLIFLVSIILKKAIA